MNKVIIIIPARFHSSRFPGKSLEMIDEYNVIQSVYLRAKQVKNADQVIVATDDERIKDSINALGGNAILTERSHENGTSRIAEVAESLGEYQYVINVQGDEPFINPAAIEDLIDELKKNNMDIVTLKKQASWESLYDVNIVKVITEKGLATKFVRRWSEAHSEEQQFFKHIGIYGFKRKTLLDIVNLEPSTAEINESLEQLRWLDNGYEIGIIETDSESIGIDVPEDLEKARHYASSLT